MRNITYLLLALCLLVRLVGAQTPKSYSYQILYTGRTLGYARIPDEQTLPANNGGPSRTAQEFIDQFKSAEKSDIAQFRIAMGDNFSPDLFGRSIRLQTPAGACDGRDSFYQPTVHLTKDYFTFVPPGKDVKNDGWHVWCHLDEVITREDFTDNVAGFLAEVHYDTVVPGKHDFYFGPQYLRQIADYLRGKGVQMLGENMIVVSALAQDPLNAHPRIPERLAQPCHLNTGNDHDCYHTDFGAASLDLPDNVLPWKRLFVLHGARSATIKGTNTLIRKDQLKNFKDTVIDYHPVFDPDTVDICVEPGAATVGDPAKVLKENAPKCYRLAASDKICDGTAKDIRIQSACKAIYPDPDNPDGGGVYDAKKQAGSTDITFLFRNPDDHLSAGLNHMFCVRPSEKSHNSAGHPFFGKDPSTGICQAFPVQLPMFWPDNDVTTADPKPAPGTSDCKSAKVPCPYALVERGPDGGKANAAIFAVVDPDLLSNVGMLNTSWYNRRNKRWDTAAQITAPDFALLQTLDLCNADDACRKAPKILMAQMSYARATQLLSNSSFSGVFDVVLTQASPEHDTGIVEKKYQGKTPRFALTPPAPMSPDSGPDEDTQNKGLAQAPTKVMSMPVFTPQVYVATIRKEEQPQGPKKADAPASTTPPAARMPAAPSPAPSSTCMASPSKEAKAAAPPPDGSLPSKAGLHDFGPCWTMSNTSAAWDFSRIKKDEPYTIQKDVTKVSSYPPGRPRRLCLPGTDSDSCLSLESLASKYLADRKLAGTAQANPTTAPPPSDPISQAVLVAMRNALKTDASIIQSRDLYEADNLGAEQIERGEIQDQISRIIWKGDEAIVLHMTGATIRKLLKQSAAFGLLDSNSLNTEVELGRGLVTLGIYPDPKDSDTIYINGAVMSDTALYTIAATDFISGGDTGYANLAPPDVLPALRVHDFGGGHVHPVAGLVCKAINPKGACADMRLGDDYFDDSTQAPADATAGFSTSQHWRAFFRYFRMPRRPFPNSEHGVQQRPFWALKLENLDFSESGVFVNHFGKTTFSLGGISNPLIANKGTQNIGADYKVRLIYDHRRGTFYLLSDAGFQFNATTSPGTYALPTLANDVQGFEAGGTIRLPVPRNRNGLKKDTPWQPQRPSWLSYQYSVRYERPLIDPFDTQVTLTPLSNGDPSTTYLHLPTPPVNTIYGRMGLRGKSGDAYLEIGLEQIDARNLLTGYVISPSNGQVTYCQPRASVALDCSTDPTFSDPSKITTPSKLSFPGPLGPPTTIEAVLHTTSYRTPGAYLNFYWKFPLWSRRDANRADQSVFFTLTNKGDIYFNQNTDTAVQTRYLDKLTPAISFPIWAGISLTPKADFILYENKINRYHYRTVQPSISLSYTFSWREGMGWSRALRYGAQTTAASPAGSTH